MILGTLQGSELKNKGTKVCRVLITLSNGATPIFIGQVFFNFYIFYDYLFYVIFLNRNCRCDVPFNICFVYR